MSTPTRRQRITIAETSALRAALLLLAVLVVLRYFESVTRVLLLVYAAAVLAVALNAIVRRIPLQRKIVSALVALGIVVLLITVVWIGGSLLLKQLRSLLENLPQIDAQVSAWADRMSQRTGIDVRSAIDAAQTALANAFAGGGIMGRARTLVDAIMLPIAILAGGLFALANPNNRLLIPVLRVVPDAHRDSVRRALDLLGDRLVGWIQGQILAMLIVGTLATIACYAIGVPYALLLGVLNAFTEFIPIFGPWIGGIPTSIVAATSDPMKGVWTALAMLAIQLIENTMIMPFVMSNRAKVHPFITLFALMMFGSLFGFFGVLLSIPLVILVWTIVQVFWVEGVIHADDDPIAPVVEE